MPSLTKIVATVNEAVPNHDRTIVRPEIIEATRTASCFGRAALVGAALLEQGLPPDALSLLISEAHGMRRQSGRLWFGHTELVIDDGERSALVLTTMGVEIGSLRGTTWQLGAPREQQGVITGVATLPATGVLFKSSEVAAYLGGAIEDPAIFASKDSYRVHAFDEGVAFYQRTHPGLNVEPLVEVADYAALYERLAAPQ